MPSKTDHQPAVRLHLTNVAGAGATQLLQSLLPALELCSHFTITEIYIPDRGVLANRADNTMSSASDLEPIRRMAAMAGDEE